MTFFLNFNVRPRWIKGVVQTRNDAFSIHAMKALNLCIYLFPESIIVSTGGVSPFGWSRSSNHWFRDATKATKASWHGKLIGNKYVLGANYTSFYAMFTCMLELCSGAAHQKCTYRTRSISYFHCLGE